MHQVQLQEAGILPGEERPDKNSRLEDTARGKVY